MQEQSNERFVRMTTQPVGRLISRLAVPTIISMLVTSIYNMADTYFVSRINTESTAAVGVVFSLMAILQAVGFFFGHCFARLAPLVCNLIYYFSGRWKNRKLT